MSEFGYYDKMLVAAIRTERDRLSYEVDALRADLAAMTEAFRRQRQITDARDAEIKALRTTLVALGKACKEEGVRGMDNLIQTALAGRE